METKDDKNKKKKTTEITTLAKEAEKGAEIPSKEELDKIAHRDFTSGLVTLERMLKTAVKSKGTGKLSARSVVRILIALLQFPEEDLEVDIKSGLEEVAFGIGQRVQMARFYLMMEQVNQMAKAKKQEKKTKNKPKKETKNVKQKEE